MHALAFMGARGDLELGGMNCATCSTEMIFRERTGRRFIAGDAGALCRW
jgi:hypothetical protein